MVKESINVIKGYFIWLSLKSNYHLTDKSIALVLTGENEKVDNYALKYLDNVIERKCANNALVIAPNAEIIEKARTYTGIYPLRKTVISDKKIDLVYKWHCLDRSIYKNLIFTYIRTNKDNLLGRFLAETEVNEEDIVCLALYNLREIPMQK